MTLKLYFHPLSSFSWKALIALYENDTPFEPIVVNFGDPQSRAAFEAVWPLAKFPVLKDEARDAVIAESTTIMDYLDTFYPGRTRFTPADPDAAWRARMLDRVFDNYIHVPMQKNTADILRPADNRDPTGVEQARAQIRAAYALLERDWPEEGWAMGQAFSLADVSAFPALLYGNLVTPLGENERKLASYLTRLKTRPSIQRTFQEAAPFFQYYPGDPKPSL